MSHDDRGKLPDDTQTRIRLHVENSAPSTSRPRLPWQVENMLAEVERRTAACYASMEELTFQVGKLVAEFQKGPEGDDK